MYSLRWKWEFYWLFKIYRKLIKYSKWRPPLANKNSEFWFVDCYNLLILHPILIGIAVDCIVYSGLGFQSHLFSMLPSPLTVEIFLLHIEFRVRLVSLNMVAHHWSFWRWFVCKPFLLFMFHVFLCNGVVFFPVALLCFLVLLSFPILCSGSGVVLNCFNSWFLHSSLLS